jgi:hypothetical protein
MSASKMRKVAAVNDYESFTRGLPRGYDGRKLFMAVRAGMKLSELTEVYERIVGQPQEVDAAKLKILLETITRLRDLVEKMNPTKHTKKFKDMYGEDMKCWKGYRRVPGKTPGTKGSCKKKK